MNKLEKPLLIKRDDLDEAHYFRSILEKACSLGLLSGSQLENLQLQSIELLAKQIERFTGNESSSVKTETAQNIMESIFYTIGIYLKSFPRPEMSVNALQEKPLPEVYRHGKKLIRANFDGARELLQAVKKNIIDTDNYAYTETIENGISLFFSTYDIDFAAHETPGSIDYPLSNDKMELTGIEYIYDYLKKLYWENQFCHCFTSHNLVRLLRGYDNQYEDLLINIFELVLTNAIGCIWLDKSPLRLSIEPSELTLLQQRAGIMPTDKLDVMLEDAAARLFKENTISDVLLQKYITATAKNLRPKLVRALETGRLESFFVPLKENRNQPVMQFTDGEKIDNELFRAITDEIRQCRLASDKIAIIKRELHSITDLVDVLGAYCIFGDEFLEIFAALGDMELALLFKKLPTHVIDSELHFSENEKEWQGKLGCFLEKIEAVRKKKIRELAENISIP